MAPRGNVESAANGVVRYPPPQATHAVVVDDPLIFINTLQSFCKALSIKFFFPAIDGKRLNLHLLYVEVTKSGGYEKVIEMRKWTLVSSMFLFSPRTTNAAYALKKHYFNLLYHYEQVYFFRVLENGEPSTLNSPGNGEILIPILTENVETNMPTGNNVTDPDDESNVLPTDEEGSTLTGNNDGSQTLHCVLEAKLDFGNIISVEKDNEVFYALMLNPIIPTIANHPSSMFPSNTTTSAPPTETSTDNATPSELPTNTSGLIEAPKTKGKRSRGDPERPKRHKDAYTFFVQKNKPDFKSVYPKASTLTINKKIGKVWANMKNSEKKIYQRMAMKDKERYRKEKQEYEEKKRSKA